MHMVQSVIMLSSVNEQFIKSVFRRDSSLNANWKTLMRIRVITEDNSLEHLHKQYVVLPVTQRISHTAIDEDLEQLCS